MICNKIVLGTANFDSSYGLFQNKNVSKIMVKKLLNFCRNHNIDTIDTSPDYKNAETLIGEAGSEPFKVITKMPDIKKAKNSGEGYFKDTITNSLESLKLKKIYALLFRNPKALVDKNNFYFWKLAHDLKKKGIIKKLGITVYDYTELNVCFDTLKPDIIQIPYSIFDRRIEKSGWLKKLYKNKVEIHSRSIFLQGLLLKKKNELPSKFLKYENIWNKYYLWLQQNRLTPTEACINFILKKSEISKMVLGVENINQLKKIISVSRKNINFSDWAKSINEQLIDPRKW